MAVRIAGVNLPPNKRMEIALTYVYGVGKSLSRRMLKNLNINLDIRVKDLKESDAQKLRDYILKFPIEGDLRRKMQLDVKRLVEIGCYRGSRHRKKLPVRGQKTRSNARTKKGKKITVANRKKVIKKV